MAAVAIPDDRGARRAAWALVALRVLVLAGIASSAMLVVDYANAGAPTFCGTGSGCEAVRTASITRDISGALRISIPQLGLIGNVLLFAATLLAREPLHRRLVAVAATFGAAFALYLVVVQVSEIGTLCPYCMFADGSAVLAAVAAWVVANRPPPDGLLARLAGPSPVGLVWSAAAALTAGLTFLWGAYPVVPPLPEAIAKLQKPGVVTIVEFTDFECPFCRALAPLLDELRKRDGVRFERRMMPLPMHPGATPAALAYLCTPEAQRDAMATALYGLPEESLPGQGPFDAANALGLDLAALRACVASDDARKRLDEDKALFSAVGRKGLPMTFIGRRAVVGFVPDKIIAALRAEQSGSGLELPLPPLFVAMAFVAVAAVAASRRAIRA